eukprot:750163-Hanusia_phi.AAC.2
MVEEERKRQDQERSHEISVDKSTEAPLAGSPNEPSGDHRALHDELSLKLDGAASPIGKTSSQTGSNRPPTP